MSARRLRNTLRGVAALVSLLGAPSARLAAQGTCEVNNQTSCSFGNTAGFAITVTVTAVIGLTTSASSVTLATPTGTDFASGFGTASTLGITVRANRTWTLTIQSTLATWTAVGAQARLNRPVGDLQRDTLVAGSYTDMTTTATTFVVGTATAGRSINLYLRARYAWLLDSPGDYSLPLQLTLTAP